MATQNTGTTIRYTEFKGQRILNIVEVDEKGNLSDKALLSFGLVKAQKYSEAFQTHYSEISGFIHDELAKKNTATKKEKSEATGPRW